MKERGEEIAGGDLQKGVGVDARARRETLQPRDLAAAEDERAAEERYWLARMAEIPYQNPQEFMYCEERIGKAATLPRCTGCDASVEAQFSRT